MSLGRALRRRLLHPTLVACVVVFAAALALRLTHLSDLRSHWAGTQLFSLARGDASYHWHEAQSILDQDALLRGMMPWKSAGYSYLLALAMRGVGRDPGDLRFVMAWLGALNCAGLVLLARRVLPLRYALLAGLATAANGVLIFYDGELFFPTVLIALNLLGLLALSRPRAGRVAHAAAGVCLAGAAVVHPAYLLAVAAVGGWLLLRHRRHGLLFAAAVLSTLAPFAAQNHWLRHEPVLLSASGGINLYVGNHPAFDQLSGQQIGPATWGRLLQSPADSGLESYAARDRFYYGLALRQMATSPIGTLKLWSRKAVLLLSPVELGNNVQIQEVRAGSRVLRATMGRAGPLLLPFAVWAPLALLGAVLLARGAERPAAGRSAARDLRAEPARSSLAPLLWCWAVGVAGSIVLSFNTARYRAPLVFFGGIGLAAAVAWLWGLARQRRARPLAMGVLGTVAFAVGSSVLARPQSVLPPPAAWSQGQVEEAEGRAANAEQWLLRAARQQPNDPLVMAEVAAFYGRAQAREQERSWYARALGSRLADPDLQAAAHEALAGSWLADGDLARARAAAEAALAVDADHASWHGQPYYQLGLAPSTACRLRVLLAQIELRDQRPAAARTLAEQVLSDCPQMESVRPAVEAILLRARR